MKRYQVALLSLPLLLAACSDSTTEQTTATEPQQESALKE
jgi:hypothetical protein